MESKYQKPEAPFQKSSDTSRAAAESLTHLYLTEKQAAVWRVIAASGQRGATADEIEVRLNCRSQNVTPRIVELRRDGRIIDSGSTRPTRSGRQAVVYVKKG